MFCARYKLLPEDIEGLDTYDLLCEVGRKRGFLVSGGDINTERTALMLLEEFRSAKIGRITLEAPDKVPLQPAETSSAPDGAERLCDDNSEAGV